MKKELLTLALISVSTVMVMADDKYPSDEVFGDPIVKFEGKTVTYYFDEEAIETYFSEVSSDVTVWNNANADVTLYDAKGQVIEVAHIGSWDHDITFNADLDLANGNYIVFAEGVINVTVNDEEEGNTIAKVPSPAYTYKTAAPSGIGNLRQSAQQRAAQYDLTGKRVNATKGIVIRNGKVCFCK